MLTFLVRNAGEQTQPAFLSADKPLYFLPFVMPRFYFTNINKIIVFLFAYYNYTYYICKTIIKTKVMRNGRINERNIGNHRLDGGAKRAKAVVEPVLTDEQYEAKESLRYCKMILNDGLKIYDGRIPELIQQWLDKGIAELKEFENSCLMARRYFPTEQRAVLVESKRSDIELVKGLLIHFYKL